MVRQIHPSYKHNNNAPSNNAAFIRACGFVALLGWSAFISSSNLSQWLQLAAEPQAHVERVVVRSSHQQDDGGQQNPQEPDKLPDWRLAVDCSAFDFHCLAIKQSQHLYEDYPFPYTRSYDHQDKFDWEILEEIPRDWKSHLEYQSLEEPPPSSVEYVYPPEATKKEKEQCLNSALNDSWKDQLDSLLAHRIQPEKDTNMVR